MNLFHALLLGVIEGLTEFLPVSSTGHLVLASKLLGIESSEFLKTFEIAIQVGAIGAVVSLYARMVWHQRHLLRAIAAAFIPTVVIGFGLYRPIKQLLDNYSVVLWALFVGGIVMLIFEWWFRTRQVRVEAVADINLGRGLGVGIAQVVAMIPGVSRAAATVIGGQALGLSRRAAVEFSFLLAVPTMVAAAGFDLLKTAPVIQPFEILLLLVGLVSAFVTARLSIRLLVKFVETHTLVVFAVYRIMLALVFGYFVV